ncbi:MAG: hypothetical protein Kow0013_23580 [Pararhodobacter sp.]
MISAKTYYSTIRGTADAASEVQRTVRCQQGGIAFAGRFPPTGARATAEAQLDDGAFPVEMPLERTREGDPLLSIACIRDITARTEPHAERSRARDRALAGGKGQGRFPRGDGHDSRTPLNGLPGSLTLLDDTASTRRQRAP